MTPENICLTCGELRFWNGTACVKQCPLGQFLNYTTDKCQCPLGLHWDGKNCLKCDNGR